MIPFPFNENRFSFFVADHLLVGQLCTNPKSDRSLLSCLKVTQCSTNEIGDAPLYNSCILPIQVMTTRSLPAPSKCKSGRFNAWGHSSTHWTTLRTATVMVFGVLSSEDNIMSPHIFEVGLKVNTKVYLDVLTSVVIPWCSQVAGCRSWVWQQDSAPAHKSKETQAWLQKECYDFVLFTHLPPPPPTWTCWTTSFGHTSRKSPTWPHYSRIYETSWLIISIRRDKNNPFLKINILHTMLNTWKNHPLIHSPAHTCMISINFIIWQVLLYFYFFLNYNMELKSPTQFLNSLKMKLSGKVE